MHQYIKDFLHSQHLLSFSVLQPNAPLDSDISKNTIHLPPYIHSANCFYAFDEVNYALIFKSESHTKHIQLATKYPNIGVTIATNTLKIAMIKGVQIQAYFQPANKTQQELYYKHFAFARLGAGTIYALKILYAKYTDNALIYEKKLEYHRSENERELESQ